MDRTTHLSRSLASLTIALAAALTLGVAGPASATESSSLDGAPARTEALAFPMRCCLAVDERLNTNEVLTSDNGLYSLIMQLDGNLVLYGPTGPIWATNTFCVACGSYLIMQQDGNLVLYSSGQPVWATNTSASGARFVVQDDSNLVVYNGSGQPIWSRW